MKKSKWVTLCIAMILMIGAMWFFDSEPERFVSKTSKINLIDTIGIKKEELNSLLSRFFKVKHHFQNQIDSMSSDYYRVTIFDIGDPSDFLNKNYAQLKTATRSQNGFEVKLYGNSTPYDSLELVMIADKEFVVVPAGVLAMLID
jgi:hypothetical protein